MAPPNIVFMYIDNMGFGDLACHGSKLHRTPNLDRMAAEGLDFIGHYSTSGVCTPSRGSLLTGCYPRRINLHVGGLGHSVLFPVDPKGLHPDEITLAGLLSGAGYATACVGKWHLGDQPPFLPTRHGFGEFLGVPYSEDMVANETYPDRPPLPLMRNETVIEAPVDRTALTRRYTEEGIRFIRDNQDRPFFLYLAQAMPGSTDCPFPGPEFAGQSANGPYGDAVEELDWSAGMIMKTVAELGLEENTLVVWASDNGAVAWDPPQGSNAPFKGWGYSTTEGGQRVPCLARWPGRIPAGSVTHEITTMMDFFVTLAHLGGTVPPADRTIDGHDILPIFEGRPGAKSDYDETGFFYYHMHQLQAVRSGPWKLYLPLENKMENIFGDYEDVRVCPLELYDVRNDLSEEQECAAQHPDVVARLMGLAENARADLGDWNREGANQRAAGWVDNPRPRLLGKE